MSSDELCNGFRHKAKDCIGRDNMEAYKKIEEYKGLLKDGVISTEEYLKLKHMVFVSSKQDLGVETEDNFDEIINREQFNEAMKKLEVNTSVSYSEAIAMLEDLGSWGSAAVVAEQCRQDLQEIKAQEELKRQEEQSLEELSPQTDLSTADVTETPGNTESTNNTFASTTSAATQKISDLAKGFKLTKKNIIIIAVAVLALVLIIAGSKPKVDHYYIEYSTIYMYDGCPTSTVEDHMDLYEVYANGEKKQLNKSSWSITYPSVLDAPETQITIKYKGEEIYFNLDVSY